MDLVLRGGKVIDGTNVVDKIRQIDVEEDARGEKSKPVKEVLIKSVRRADKRFPMTSPQVEREVGGRIQEARGWRVDLSQPELTIHVDGLRVLPGGAPPASGPSLAGEGVAAQPTRRSRRSRSRTGSP